MPPTVAESKGKTFDKKTKVVDDKGKTVPVPGGFKIAGDSATDVEEGVVIEDGRTNEDGTPAITAGSQFVWIPVTSASDYVRNTTYKRTEVSETAKEDENYLPEGITVEKGKDGEKEKEIVTAAGGFYISRFEAGAEGGTYSETDKKWPDATKLVSKSGAIVWNYISQEDCKTKSKEFIKNADVKSGLITGIQWDMVMKFIGDKNKDGEGNTFDVTTADSSRHTGSKAPSGQNESDKVCNIYDLEGNYYEYVAEKNGYNAVLRPYVLRGGGCDSNIQASNRYDTNGDANSIDHSFRFVLYVM